MNATHRAAWEIERQRSRLLALKRAHMRQWRADPVNRVHEREQQRHAKLERKLLLSNANVSGSFCGFCYQRPPVTKVERLVATSRGFRRIFVPYCGVC